MRFTDIHKICSLTGCHLLGLTVQAPDGRCFIVSDHADNTVNSQGIAERKRQLRASMLTTLGGEGYKI